MRNLSYLRLAGLMALVARDKARPLGPEESERIPRTSDRSTQYLGRVLPNREGRQCANRPATIDLERYPSDHHRSVGSATPKVATTHRGFVHVNPLMSRSESGVQARG